MLGFDITFVKKTLIGIGVLENNIKHSALQGVCWLVGVSILQFKLMKRSKSYKKKKIWFRSTEVRVGFRLGGRRKTRRGGKFGSEPTKTNNQPIKLKWFKKTNPNPNTYPNGQPLL